MANRGPRRAPTSAPSPEVVAACPRAPDTVTTDPANGDAAVAVSTVPRAQNAVATTPASREQLEVAPAASDQLATSSSPVVGSLPATAAVAAPVAAGDTDAAIAAAPRTPGAVATSPDAEQQHSLSSAGRATTTVLRTRCRGSSAAHQVLATKRRRSEGRLASSRGGDGRATTLGAGDSGTATLVDGERDTTNRTAERVGPLPHTLWRDNVTVQATYRTAAAKASTNDNNNSDRLCIRVSSGATSLRRTVQPSSQRPSYWSPLLLML